MVISFKRKPLTKLSFITATWGALLLMIAGGIGGGMAGRKLNKKLNNAAVDKLFMGLMAVIILISIYNTVRYAGIL